MTTLRAHFDGKHIVLDEPAPTDLPPNTQVTVSYNVEADLKPSCLDEIARMARPLNLPRDFSMNFKHYTKGTRRR